MSIQLLYDSSVLNDSIYLSGSTVSYLLTTGSLTPAFFFGPKEPLQFETNAEYTIEFSASCYKSNPNFDALLEVYLVGNAFASQNSLGYLLSSLTSNSGSSLQYYTNVQSNVIAPNSGAAYLRFVVYGGQWNISDISIQASEAFGFNPAEVDILVPVDGYRNEHLIFDVELYDANNNLVPITLTTPSIYFTGSNLVVKGVDNRIYGTLIVSPSGSAPSIASNDSGSFIGINQSGSVIAQPIYPSLLSSYTGSSLVTIYSGTFANLGNLSLSGSAVGIQIIGGTGTSQSFLDFNTMTGKLSIMGDVSLLPGSALSQSITNISSSVATGSIDGKTALAQIQALVNASGSQLPTGTFLNGNEVISPIIAGNDGYFASNFGVGNISGGNGIVLTSTGYSASNGSFLSGSPAIYIGAGQFANANTPFLVGSSSNGPVLSLADKVRFEQVSGSYTVTISGTLNVIDYGASGQPFLQTQTVIANYIAYSPFGFFISNL